MINKIKQLADEAIALQNKNRMDEVLREISAICESQIKRVQCDDEQKVTLQDVVDDLAGKKKGGKK